MQTIRALARRPVAWLGALVVCALAVVIVLPVLAPLAVPVFSLKGLLSGVTFHKLGMLGFVPMMGRTAEAELPTGGISLATKNRAATELRQRANAIREKLADTENVKMTIEEFNALRAELTVTEQRAAAVAEFTADAEITRQGGMGASGLERVDNVDAGDQRRTLASPKPTRMAARIEDFANRVNAAFGDVRSFMEVAVAGKGRPQNPAQQALIAEGHTLTRAIVGTSGDVSGGEFLLPLTQVSTIFSLANVQQGLLQRARAYNVPGRTLRIPYLIQTDENASTTLNRPMAGNIANISIVGEGSTKPVSTPQFGQRLLTVYKYAAITQVSDEMLSDDFTGELPSEFINAVGQQALNRVNEDITIDGTGTAMPTGALYPGAWNISVTRNTASSILPVDLFAMYARHTHGPNSVWFASRRTVQQLYNMSLTSASLVTFLRNLNDTPQMMILGYPVVLTDLLPTLGSEGDIALVNPDFYAFALRQALTVESSNAPGFITDVMTYRFIVRAGGLPINTGNYAYKYAGSQGVDEHSPFVYLT